MRPDSTYGVRPRMEVVSVLEPPPAYDQLWKPEEQRYVPTAPPLTPVHLPGQPMIQQPHGYTLPMSQSDLAAHPMQFSCTSSTPMGTSS
ncbi:hypothetical protein PMAYCL1PPCAC_21650, partial [Pristionchus mayeri]